MSRAVIDEQEALYEFSVRIKCRDLQHIKPGIASACIICQTDFQLSRKKLKKTILRQGVEDHGEEFWKGCDTCGRKQKGLRYACHGMKRGKIVHLLVCYDCVLYFTEGEVPEVWP